MQLKPGAKLQDGRYEIIRTLGQGGFGITYLAEQLALKKTVAIKEFFMRDCCERDDESNAVHVGTGSQRALVSKFRGKFVREAQMIAGLEHPNIVQVTDVFEENGTAYYGMETLPAGSLAEKVKLGGPFPEVQALPYIRQVASALSYLHTRNIVHLDVKPTNILLNNKGEAVLIDFGISKHYDEGGEQTSSTPVGISKGYAPLEQNRAGDVSQFKPSTDIYALGASLYFLLTGLTPPDASIVNEDGLKRPDGLSDAVWSAIETAMRPRRSERPKDIPAFLSLLPDEEYVELQSDETEVIQPGEAPDRLPGQGGPRRRLPLFLSAAVFVAGIVFFILALTLPTRAGDSEQKDTGLEAIMTHHVDSLQRLVRSLQTEVGNQKAKNKELNDNNTSLSSANKRLQDDNQRLKKTNEELNGRLSRLLE